MQSPRLLVPFAAVALLAAVPASARPFGEPAPGAIEADPAADQLLWSPTGQTHPAGTAYVNTYNLWGIETGYAPTSRLQFSLSGAYLLRDGLGMWGARLKWQAFRGKHAHVALFGGANYAAEVQIAGEPSTAAVVSAGAAADACVFDCHLTVAASVERFQSFALSGPKLRTFSLPATRATFGAAVAVSDSIKLLAQGEVVPEWIETTAIEGDSRSTVTHLPVWPTAGVRWFRDRYAIEIAGGYSAASAGNLALLVGGTLTL